MPFPSLSPSSLDMQVVYDRRAILCRYAKGWLIVDFLAAFPLTFLPTLGPDDLDGNHEVAYLLSFPKIFQLFGLLILAQENFRLHEGGFLAVRTLISVIVVSRRDAVRGSREENPVLEADPCMVRSSLRRVCLGPLTSTGFGVFLCRPHGFAEVYRRFWIVGKSS